MVTIDKIEKGTKNIILGFLLLGIDIVFISFLTYSSYTSLMDNSSGCFIDYCTPGKTFSFLSVIASLLNLATSLPIIVLGILIIIYLIKTSKKRTLDKDGVILNKNISRLKNTNIVNLTILLVYLAFYIYYSIQ